MKFLAEKDTLTHAISWVVRMLPSRPTLPTLAGVHLAADDGTLTLRATDLDLAATVTIDAQIDEPGTVVIPGRLLNAIAGKLPDAPVEVASSKNDEVHVTCGRARWKLRTMPTDDFPAPASPDDTTPHGTITAEGLTRLDVRTTRAAGTDEARAVLTGVLINGTADKIVAAATDSYRLAVTHVAWDGPDTPVQALLPARAVSEAAGLAATKDTEVTIHFGDKITHFHANGRTLTTSHLEGIFPTYEQLIPNSHETLVTVDRHELIEAAQRVAVIAVAQVNVPLLLTVGDQTVDVRADNQEVGDASEALPADVEGDDTTIAFNPGFLLAGLEGLDTDKARLYLQSLLKPAVIRGTDDSDDLYLIMPVKTS